MELRRSQIQCYDVALSLTADIETVGLVLDSIGAVRDGNEAEHGGIHIGYVVLIEEVHLRACADCLRIVRYSFAFLILVTSSNNLSVEDRVGADVVLLTLLLSHVTEEIPLVCRDRIATLSVCLYSSIDFLDVFCILLLGVGTQLVVSLSLCKECFQSILCVRCSVATRILTLGIVDGNGAVVGDGIAQLSRIYQDSGECIVGSLQSQQVVILQSGTISSFCSSNGCNQTIANLAHACQLLLTSNLVNVEVTHVEVSTVVVAAVGTTGLVAIETEILIRCSLVDGEGFICILRFNRT